MNSYNFLLLMQKLYSGYNYQYMDPLIDREKYYEFTFLTVALSILAFLFIFRVKYPFDT
jgi:hypothetical protein